MKNTKDQDTTEIIIRHVPKDLKRAVKTKSAFGGVTMNDFIIDLMKKDIPEWNAKETSHAS